MINRVVLGSEVWKPIEGYEGLYQVSNFGRVKSNDRKVWNGRGYYNKSGRILKNSLTTTGYWKVELYKNGERKSWRVHRLVAKAFIPRVRGKNMINHKDGDPLNNHVSNLEWCNQSENMKHAYEMGLMESNFTKNKNKILNEYVKNKNVNVMDLSRKYKCSDASIRKHLKENGVKIRGISQSQDIYGIDRKKMVLYFKKGLGNKEIAEIFNANSALIGTYRYKHKKGELKI